MANRRANSFFLFLEYIQKIPNVPINEKISKKEDGTICNEKLSIVFTRWLIFHWSTFPINGVA